jgi:type IV secretory pathway VirD2 relaxase
MSEDDFRLRPGAIRSKGARPKSFLAQALRAAERAGGLAGKGKAGRSRFGRGRAASLAAAHSLASGQRRVVIKARVVRQRGSIAALRTHVRYLERDGVTRDGAPGQLFDAGGDAVDGRAFAERCDGDRHHFRFIVAPEDAADLGDLRATTRALMANASRDLGTDLDWVAVDHWNTEHPHVHVLVRGRTADRNDLVISRDYISRGMAARASALVTAELGPRTSLEIARDIDRQVDAERWTRLDQVLVRQAREQDGVVDMRLAPGAAAEPFRAERMARLRTWERLGLAACEGPGRYRPLDNIEARLRALGERGDIIKQLHQSLSRNDVGADLSAFVLEGERAGPVLGRLAARGLDDELKGTAFAIVEGVDGRSHHVKLPTLDAASDAPIGGIVELRRFKDARGSERIALAVRSDLTLEAQTRAMGATWLDRQLVAKEPPALGAGGFGAEVRQALDARAAWLDHEGLARRAGERLLPTRNLMATLRDRELTTIAATIAQDTGLLHRFVAAGDQVTGVFQRRLDLASGRFAVIEGGAGFQLVPWLPSLETRLGRQVSGIASPGGGIDWDFGRKRGLSL